MKLLFKWIYLTTPFVIVIIFSFTLFFLFYCDNFISSILFKGLVASLIALIPFNYYYTSSTAIEFKSFTKCNRRFDEMNELLNLIDLNNSKKNNNEILDKMIERNGNIKTVNQIILDYLDLCAEEYYLYKYSGIISRKVWEHWLNGMLYYFVKGDIFHQVILKERKLRENSYYGFIKFILKKIK